MPLSQLYMRYVYQIIANNTPLKPILVANQHYHLVHLAQVLVIPSDNRPHLLPQTMLLQLLSFLSLSPHVLYFYYRWCYADASTAVDDGSNADAIAALQCI